MSMQDDDYRKLSLRERSKLNSKKRNRERLLRAVFVATVGILMIVIVFLAFALSNVGKKDKRHLRNKTAVSKATPSPKKEAATASPSPTPTPTVAATGAARWLRTDLDKDKPMVAFTFDDGPYTKVTKRLVDYFKKNNGRCTFFVVGNRVSTYKDTLKYAYENGNEIGSHTYDHKDLSKFNKKGVERELSKTNKAVKSIIGCETTILRPPYGNVSKTMRNAVKVPMFYWSIDSEDWKSRKASSVIKRCGNLKDGDIVLMHDLYPTTADAVEKILKKYSKKGYQFVTLDELFYYKDKEAKPGKVYFDAK